MPSHQLKKLRLIEFCNAIEKIGEKTDLIALFLRLMLGPCSFKMNQNEFDRTIDRLLDGAARVRAKKIEGIDKAQNIPRELTSRIIPNVFDEDSSSMKVA